MPRLLLLATVLCALPRASLAEELPDLSLSYRIQVRIDPETRSLTGRETLRWTNRSERAVARVPLHLYLNAFAHLGTTFIQEGIESFGGWLDLDRFLRQYPDPWGWIAPKRIDQLVAGQRHRAGFRPIQPDDGNPQDLTLVEVSLPRPVPPGGTLELAIRFEARLPVPIARTGCTPDFCLVAQWFPKIGVLELPGVRGAKQPRWAARQFHAATEFYADFADYEVTIEAPAGWTVGATGRRTASGKAAGGYRSVRYAQRAVHDFAIVLGNDLHDARVTHRPLGKGRPVEVRYLLPRGVAHQVDRARRATETTIDLFARHVGPYPYETLTVVLPPYRAMRTSGMEYPTLITGTPADPAWDRFPFADFGAAEFTIVHEFGHQYFYGLLASNEQEEAFLDEGINSHWDGQGMRAVFGRTASAGWVLGRPVDALEFYRHGLGLARHRIREPLSKRPSALFYPGTQRFHNYHRGALTMWTAVNRFGQPLVDRVFSAYYRRFRFRHPGLEDFLGVVAETGGAEVTAFLREALVKESVPDFRVASISSWRYKLPLGRFTDRSGSVVVTEDNRERLLERFADPRWRDRRRLWVQVTDPGWVHGDRQSDGTVRWLPLPRRGGAADGKALYESRVLIQGPGWEHLPVFVLLRFEDGAEARERWDGKAAWRGYRVVRPSRLKAVRIDEADRVTLDCLPQNNGRSLEADRRFAADWGGWLGALVQWLAGGLSLWL